MFIPDYDTFGMYERLDLRLPTNLMQRIALWRVKHAMRYQYSETDALRALRPMRVLNQYARSAHGDYRWLIYSLKADLLKTLDAYGYIGEVDAEQQILKCHSCTRGIWEYGTNHEEICFKCNGTGIYKRVLLYKFTVNVRGEEFEFHQPSELVRFGVTVKPEWQDRPLDELPRYRESKTATRVHLSTWQLHSNLITIAYFVASKMMFEGLNLSDWRAALVHDAKEICNHAYRRVRHLALDVRYWMERRGWIEPEFPF